MPKFVQVTPDHISTATEILWHLSLETYAPLKAVVLCPLCSGLKALLETIEKRVLSDPEEIIEARAAAGTCLVMGEVLRQLDDMLANVNDLAVRGNRARLKEVDLCIGSLQSLAVTAQCKMDSLVQSLQLFHPDTSSLQSNWSEFTTWICGVLLSLYCIQKPKIWMELMANKPGGSFTIDSYLVSPNTSKALSASSLNDEAVQDHSTGVKLVTTTLMEEIVVFSEHLSEVSKQLTEISSVLRDSGVTHFPNPLPY